MTERADGERPPDAAPATDTTDAPQAPAPTPLTEPRDGVPVPMTTLDELATAVEALRGGERLPIAIDAERASGYRYGQRAYLVQLRREDVGTMLFDPVYLPDLSTLGAVIADDEWVLHAA
jgi:ribonuclease D